MSLPGSTEVTRREAQEVLGISADATAEETRKAYRRLVTVAHPDRGGSDYLFRRVSQAYEVLSGPPEKTTERIPHAPESTSQGASQAGSRDPADKLNPIVRQVLEAVADEGATEGLERLIGDRAPAAQAAVRVFLGVLRGPQKSKKKKK